MPIFFVEKNVRSFCSAKASLIFSTKNIKVFGFCLSERNRVKYETSSGVISLSQAVHLSCICYKLTPANRDVIAYSDVMSL